MSMTITQIEQISSYQPSEMCSHYNEWSDGCDMWCVRQTVFVTKLKLIHIKH